MPELCGFVINEDYADSVFVENVIINFLTTSVSV